MEERRGEWRRGEGMDSNNERIGLVRRAINMHSVSVRRAVEWFRTRSCASVTLSCQWMCQTSLSCAATLDAWHSHKGDAAY